MNARTHTLIGYIVRRGNATKLQRPQTDKTRSFRRENTPCVLFTARLPRRNYTTPELGASIQRQVGMIVLPPRRYANVGRRKCASPTLLSRNMRKSEIEDPLLRPLLRSRFLCLRQSCIKINDYASFRSRVRTKMQNV